MIRHCVLLRWNDGVPAATLAAVAAGLDRMAGLEPVLAYHHGPDAGLSEGNWDHVIVADFADAEGYSAYATHPDHLALLAELIRPNLAARAAVQTQL